MKRFWPLILFLVACQSGPLRTLASQKATPGASRNSVELEILVAYAPRRSPELQSAVILNSGAQECLRQTLRTGPVHFSVDFSGSVSSAGRLVDLKINSPWPDLNPCLERALAEVQLSAGSLGPFEMRIRAVQPGEHVGKTFLLDLNAPPKKYQ